MASFAIDPISRELKIPLEIVEGECEVEQRLRTRFRFFRGTWFLDTDAGVPYYDDILLKNPSFPIVGGILREVALTTPGVQSLNEFDLDLDSNRELRVSINPVFEEPDLAEVDRRFVITSGGHNE